MAQTCSTERRQDSRRVRHSGMAAGDRCSVDMMLYRCSSLVICSEGIKKPLWCSLGNALM